jgi:hypothetical protein
VLQHVCLLMYTYTCKIQYTSSRHLPFSSFCFVSFASTRARASEKRERERKKEREREKGGRARGREKGTGTAWERDRVDLDSSLPESSRPGVQRREDL